METTQFILEGYCQGAYPVEGNEDIVDEEWYKEIIDLIRKGDHSAALEIAKEHFIAEYNTENIAIFDECGIAYVRTLSANLKLPFIENNGENDIALFKWIGGHFLMEGPSDIVESWIEADERGLKIFRQEKFDNWFGDDSSLQDGCCYNLGPCWYDLEGFGENGCRVIAESVVSGLADSLDEFISQITTKCLVDEESTILGEVDTLDRSSSTPAFTDLYQEALYKLNCEDAGMEILTLDIVRYFLGLDSFQLSNMMGQISSKISRDCVLDALSTMLLLTDACHNPFSPVIKECLDDLLVEARIKHYWIYILEQNGSLVDTRDQKELELNDHNYTISISCADFICHKMLVNGAGPNTFIDLSKSNMWTDRLIAARYATGNSQLAAEIEVDQPSVEKIRESLKTDSLISGGLYVIRDAAQLGDDYIWAG